MSKYNYNDLILSQLESFRPIVRTDDDLDILLTLFLSKIITANSTEEVRVMLDSLTADNEIDDKFKLLTLRACDCTLDLILTGTQPAQAILLVINYLRK